MLEQTSSSLPLRLPHTFLNYFREVLLGETTVGEDPDCWVSKCFTPAIKRYISKIIVHEDYLRILEGENANVENDIALIRVDRPIPLFSEDSSLSSIIPVCLPWLENDPGRNLAEGEILVFTGWGRTSNDQAEYYENIRKDRVASKRLKLLKLPYLSKDDEKCSLYNLLDSQICAGGEKGWYFFLHFCIMFTEITISN